MECHKLQVSTTQNDRTPHALTLHDLAPFLSIGPNILKVWGSPSTENATQKEQHHDATIRCFLGGS